MNTIIATKPPFKIQPEDEYPSSDGQPMAETEVHILALTHLLNALRFYFRNRDDVYVIGDMFLYYREGNPRARKAPDIMVVKGVDATIRRRSYKLWEEGVPPCIAIELTSGQTKKEDIVTKPALYAALGIKEYILFDPLYEYLDEQLIGYRLDADGEYVLIEPDSDGDLHSEELGLIFSIDDATLRVVDPETGEYIPALEEAIEQAEEAMQRAEKETQRAEQEAQRAEQEAQRALEAEGEADRLRELLKKLGHEDAL
ncbi:MAG: Uma2 family endonuclease [Caldilineaceae bacterium]